jgi:hypothetical protein
MIERVVEESGHHSSELREIYATESIRFNVQPKINWQPQSMSQGINAEISEDQIIYILRPQDRVSTYMEDLH